MSEQEILEGNKLIAEFMGEKNIHISGGNIWILESPVRHVQDQHVYVRYYSSWDLIMPVVEKIHSDTDFWVTIYYRSCKVFPMNIGVEMEILIEEKPTIEAVWIAVVEFIKWHNKQQGK